MNLTQLMMTPQNIEQLARQFDLTQGQAQEAMAALLPAFSAGLKRNAQTSQQAAQFVEALASGRHARFAEDPAEATTRAGIAEGNGILSHIFRSPDVRRQVASYAAANSGIGQAVLKQMLPVIASMVMGALFKGATGGRSGGNLGKTLGQAAGGGILGTLIEGLAGGLIAGGKQAMPTGRGSSGGLGLEDLLGSVLGGGAATRRKRPSTTSRTRSAPRSGSGSGGLEDLLGDIFAPRPRAARPRSTKPAGQAMPPARQPRAPRRPRGEGGLGSIFGDMLEPGPSTDATYQRKTRTVIDDLLGN